MKENRLIFREKIGDGVGRVDSADDKSPESLAKKELRKKSEDVVNDLACREVKTGESSFLKMACEAEIDDLDKKLLFVEAWRSAPELKVLAEKLVKNWEPCDRKFKALYPGSGAHLAPIVLPVALIDAGKIDEADLVLTEIRPDVKELGRNIVTLTKLDSNFQIPELADVIERGKVAREIVFTVYYKEKPIRIKFMYKCSGDDWFRKEDFNDSDVYVSHDSPGADVSAPLILMTEYFKNKDSLSLAEQIPRGVMSGISMLSRYFNVVDTLRKVASVVRVKKLPVVVMEDLTRTMNSFYDKGFKYRRQFDLELIGKFTRGEKGYGHRDKLRKELEKCVEDKKGAEDCYSEAVETGRADSQNGVLLGVYPQLLGLSNAEFQVLMEISLIAKNPDNFEGDIAGLNGDRQRLTSNLEGMQMLAGNPYVRSDILKYGDHILDVLNCVDPRLTRGLVLRIFQIFTNERMDTDHWSGVVGDVKAEYASYIKFLSGIRKYLNNEDEEKLGKYFDLLERFYQKNKSDYRDSGNMGRVEWRRYRNDVLLYKKQELDYAVSRINKYTDNLFGEVSRGW